MRGMRGAAALWAVALLAGVLLVGGCGDKGKADGEAGPGVPVSVGPILTNLADGRRYAEVTATLWADTEETARELERARPAVIDLVLGILRSRAAEDLAGAGGMEAVRAAILGAVNAELPKGKVLRVTFERFVVQ